MGHHTLNSPGIDKSLGFYFRFIIACSVPIAEDAINGEQVGSVFAVLKFSRTPQKVIEGNEPQPGRNLLRTANVKTLSVLQRADEG